MFKNRYQLRLIIDLAILLLIIGLIIPKEIEKYGTYVACKKAMSSFPGDEPLKYQSVTFSPPSATVTFTNKMGGRVFCRVLGSGLKWQVIATGDLMDWPYP